MKLNPVARRLIRNLLVVLFFGFLSILMGKIRFFIPGYVETVSDLREIILMISVIFSPHWSMAIGITLITSLSSPTLFIYGSMVLNHGLALVSTWFIYHRYVKHMKRIRQIALTWFVFVLFYYYVCLFPIMFIRNLISHKIASGEVWSSWLSLLASTRFEVLTTLMVTTLFFVLVTLNRSLNEKIKWLDFVFQKGNIGVWDLDVEQNKRVFNEQWPAHFGYDGNSMVLDRSVLPELVHEDDWPQIAEKWQDLMRSTQPIYSAEFRVRTRDGQWKWIQDHGRVVEWDAAGKPKRIAGIQIDITESRQLKEAYLTEQEKLAVAMESIQDSVIMIDLQNRIMFVNPAAETLLKQPRSAILGQNIDDLYQLRHPKNDRSIQSAIERSLLEQSPAESERPLQLQSDHPQKILVTEKAAPMFNSKQEMIGAILIARNVSKQVQMEEQLNHANKMEAVGQLAGGVAHDFNNMLSGIITSAQLLAKVHPPKDERSRKYMDIILGASERAADLTGKLLRFGRKDKPLLITVDIHQVLDDCLAILTRTIDRKIDVRIERHAGNMLIRGDNSELQNAIINLGINASHAMAGKENGQLSIRTENVELSDAYCSASPFELKPGDFVAIEISDTGCGIPAEYIEKIFEPFFTTKAPGEGTGLGLAAVYGTVVNHHGEIHVYSEIDRGTIFKILLPCMTDTELRRQPAEKIEQGDGQLVLLVDDEYFVRVTGEAILKHLGYRVIVAENGNEAIQLFNERSHEIDLVLMDMIMPEKNGFDAFHEMINIDKQAKIVITSGFSKPERLDELMSAGLAGFISKPFRDIELSRMLGGIFNP